MSADHVNNLESSLRLDAGASVSDLPMDDSFAQYAQMMDDIEAEVAAAEDEEDAGIIPSFTNHDHRLTSALPAHLAAHAAEFWFPESRHCACCNGYKHGCTCCQRNGGVCSSCSSTSATTTTTFTTSHYDPTASRFEGSANTSKVPCKFFSTSGGCRFGDACRFGHV